jgi:preprotein translocase subunit SecA
MAAFTEMFENLREQCNDGWQNRRKLMDQLRDDVAARTRQTAAQLAEQSSERRSEFTAMMNNLRDNVQQQAAQTRQQLADLAADLRRGGAVFNRR